MAVPSPSPPTRITFISGLAILTPVANAAPSATTPASQVAVPFVKGTTPLDQQRLELDLLAGLERDFGGVGIDDLDVLDFVECGLGARP